MIYQYLMTIIAAVVIVALSSEIVGKNSPHSKLIQLISGIFLTITFLKPITNLDISHIYNYFDQLEFSSENYIADGSNWNQKQMSSYIKEQVESYILDKASSLGLTLNVEIELSETNPPVPISVKLEGNANPYQKQRLQRFIEDDFGIKLEAQMWNS